MGRSPYPLQHRFHLWLRDVPSLFFLALPLGGLPVLFAQPQQIGRVRLVDQQLPHLLLRPVVLGNVSLTRIHPTSVELKHLEAMRRKAAEKADSIAQSTTDTLNSKKEKQPETPDTTSVTKTPQRLSPAELRRQQQRQR